MKKAFIINFSTSVLIDVVKNLKEKGIDIVYWEGYRDDFDALSNTKKGFEKTIFRHAFDAIKNIPPHGIDTSEFEPLSKEIIEKMHQYGWHALSMIQRADYDESHFIKQRDMYYGYIKFWHGMIQKLKPDVIIFVAVPHSATSIVLYGLAKIFKIKIIILERLVIDSRTLLLGDYVDGYNQLAQEYAKTRDEKCNLENLSPDLRNYYNNQKHTKKPAQLRDGSYAHHLTRNNKMPFRVPSIIAVFRHIYHFTFFKVAKSYISMLFSKRKTHYYNKDFTGFTLTAMNRKWSRMNNDRKKEYFKLQSEPDYGKKYIYLPLAYQPEQTTCPMGGVFDDQALMVDIISAALPQGWMLYVKEHIPQWYPHHTESRLYRYAGYYDRIMHNKNVQLIPAQTHPFELIKNAQAVATTTGTSGLEAILRSKPVLIFGYIWYMHCEGVFRISNLEECKDALEKIKQGYTVNQQRVINYLKVVDIMSIKAKNYKSRDYTENKEITKKENILNITNALYKAIIN